MSDVVGRLIQFGINYVIFLGLFIGAQGGFFWTGALWALIAAIIMRLLTFCRELQDRITSIEEYLTSGYLMSGDGGGEGGDDGGGEGLNDQPVQQRFLLRVSQDPRDWS